MHQDTIAVDGEATAGTDDQGTNGRLRIEHLTLDEAMAFHLAGRLMCVRAGQPSPHLASALRKLGLALEQEAPLLSQHVSAAAEVMESEAKRYDGAHLEALETLTQAWSQGHMVHVWHRHKTGRVDEYDFAPYFVEPCAVGPGHCVTCVVGWREPPGTVRTFRIDRMQRVELTSRPYTVPAHFDPRGFLADAWGMWYTEAQPVELVLRFHPRVVDRVRESRWYRSEWVQPQPDGSLVWSAPVAEPREMLRWIQGWGADVEVVRPAGLRDWMIGEACRMAEMYGWEVDRTG
jgi:CRISPR-associated endonuclease/helicase Cas3